MFITVSDCFVGLYTIYIKDVHGGTRNAYIDLPGISKHYQSSRDYRLCLFKWNVQL